MNKLALTCGNFPHHASHIHEAGQELYGSSWGGCVRYCLSTKTMYYPTVNMALGRLIKRGYVERRDNPFCLIDGHSYGAWKLTPEAKELLGAP